MIASTFLGLVPSPATPELPPDTRWHPVNALPPMAFDHGPMVTHARTRLAAKMSYTNIGFALAPKEFALSTLRDIYGAALGYQVDATNLQRVLVRRGVITQTGTVAQSGRSGGRPAALYRFTDSQLTGHRRIRRPQAARPDLNPFQREPNRQYVTCSNLPSPTRTSSQRGRCALVTGRSYARMPDGHEGSLNG